MTDGNVINQPYHDEYRSFDSYNHPVLTYLILYFLLAFKLIIIIMISLIREIIFTNFTWNNGLFCWLMYFGNQRSPTDWQWQIQNCSCPVLILRVQVLSFHVAIEINICIFFGAVLKDKGPCPNSFWQMIQLSLVGDRQSSRRRAFVTQLDMN